MTPHDLIYDSIYKKALNDGCIERIAKSHAQMGLEDYKKGKFKKSFDLIQNRIKLAKKESKNAS